MKRKLLMIMMVCVLFIGAYPAAAENGDTTSNQRWAKGTVQPADVVDVFAPLGGQLMPFDVKVGDVVDAGAQLFTVRPINVLSPAGGTVRLVRGKVGDQASNVIQQYSALCQIERTDVMRVRATTTAAYNKPKNRTIVLGETLRVYDSDSGDSTPGTVVLVNGASYTVEISSVDFDLEDKVKLYRGEGDTYNAKDKVGEGVIERAPLVPVLAEGVIAGIQVSEGQTVAQGDALFIMDDAASSHSMPAQLFAAASKGGVITAIFVQDGQQIRKDQLLLTLKPVDLMEFVVDVDEMDVPSVILGQTMQVKADALQDKSFTAVVKKISPLGITVLDTTKYHVTLTIQGQPDGLLPDMHVTAYWD